MDDADTMNEESANSFLMTLEEPPERAILILIASNLDALLPTIRSRCQLIRFSPLENSDIESLLMQQDLVQSAAEAQFASALSDGSLATAKQLLEPELRLMRSLLYSQLSQPNFSGLGLSKQLTEGLSKISTETPVQRIYGQWLIRFTIEFFRETLWILHGPTTGFIGTIPEAQPFARRLANYPDYDELLGSLIERTIDASSHIVQNVSVPMMLDSLFDALCHQLKPVATTR